jgi:secondary thiamine-phosphate synthase enzyme
MTVYYKEIDLDSPKGKLNYYNITETVKNVVGDSNIKNGVCYVITLHTTCSVFFEEFSHDYSETGDEYLQDDLSNLLDTLIPKFSDHDKMYKHPGPLHVEFAERVGSSAYLTSNTDAHLRATLIGNSITVPIINGELHLGRLGSLYFVDFDHRRSRTRKYVVQTMGE